jgi:hypothetical protein
MTAACLLAAGCTAASQAPPQASSAASSGTASPGLALGSTPAGSGFASSVATAVPPSQLGPPADPFAGTPGDHWADGAAGIVLPAAAAAGPYTKAQVEYAYQTTRKLLIAANLDKKELLGGAPTAFADLMTKYYRAWFLAGLNKKGLDKQGNQVSTRVIVTSFAPGSTQLIGSVIKVHGVMHGAQVVRVHGSPELDIHLDYLFVYPVEPPHQPTEWTRVVVEDQWTVGFADWQGAATSFEPSLLYAGDSAAGAECGTTDGYVHPAYPSVAATANPSASPTGTPINPYVLGQSVTGKCVNMTGT